VVVKLGPTSAAFSRLSKDRQATALGLLNDLRSDEDGTAVLRSIALCLYEYRLILGRISYPKFGEELKALADKLQLPTEEFSDKNFENFVTRVTLDPSFGATGPYALFAHHALEGPHRARLMERCFKDQLQHLDWVRTVLATGARPEPRARPPSAASDEASATGPAIVPDLSALRRIIDGKFHARPDEHLWAQLMGGPNVHQTGFLCFRSALSEPRTIVQSYLTILSPQRSGVPFWTFAHVYEKEQEQRLRMAGGLVQTTWNSLNMVGVEGWIDRHHAHAPSAIFQHLSWTNWTMHSFPLSKFAGLAPIPGLTLGVNADDDAVAARVVLKRCSADSHEDLVGLVHVDDFPARLKELADQGRISRLNPGEVRDLLRAINNQPAFEFLDANERAGGQALSHKNLEAMLHDLFEDTRGNPVYTGMDGKPYDLALHQWFNGLGWKT
jgi:hypothetical protein